jgi:hypothetical protein
MKLYRLPCCRKAKRERDGRGRQLCQRRLEWRHRVRAREKLLHMVIKEVGFNVMEFNLFGSLVVYYNFVALIVESIPCQRSLTICIDI